MALCALVMFVLSAVAWQPQKTYASAGGTASFSDGGYASEQTTYSYTVTGAPPNVCGTLDLYRNGVHEVTPGWICTDDNGNATKGPWTPTRDETGDHIFIEWPDGTRTSGGDFQINDVTPPQIHANQSGGTGVPIPSVFDGTASDAEWGTGFISGAVSGWFRNTTTGQYWNGTCYCAASTAFVNGAISPASGGFNITWSIAAPPPSAHRATDTYEWFARARDRFHEASLTLTFTRPRVPSTGGTASFSDGGYASEGMSYTYSVTNAPPNVCGTLDLYRNGVHEVTPGWICTDGSGNATKGPWTATQDETGDHIFIEWPDGTRTSGGDFQINDVTPPQIHANQSGGTGVPIPSVFDGTASDQQWGTGFKFGAGGWSDLKGWFHDVTTDLYWNGTCYCATSVAFVNGTVAPPSGGFNITWSISSPPPSAHNATDTYEWYAHTRDRFHDASTTLVFGSAPSAIFHVPSSVGEGELIDLSLTDPVSTNPASLQYAFDCGSGYGPFGTSSTAHCPTTDNGSLTVRGSVRDSNARSQYSAEVTINNVAPTATFAAPASVIRGSPIGLSLNDPQDVAADLASLQYAFDCGSGYGPFEATNTASCPTPDSESVIVHGKVRDKDGGVTEYSSTVAIGLPSVGRSPFPPPAHNDSTFVVDEAPGLDTGCSRQGDHSFSFDIPVDRFPGDVGKLKNNGLIGQTALLKMPAFDIAFSGGNGINPERDRVYFNGNLVPTEFLTGDPNTWELNSFRVPIEWVNFPADPGDRHRLTPETNTVRIDIDTGNTKTFTCTSVDWAALSIQVTRPIFLVHGILSSSDAWQQVWVPRLAGIGVPAATINLGALDSIQDNAAKIKDTVDSLRDRWGVDKLNIVSHSKGGLDSRHYVEDHDTVATLAQMGTPNAGSPLADAIQKGLLRFGFLPAAIVDFFAPAAYQLTTYYMKGYYNRFHGPNPNTTYVSLAGDYRFGGFFGFIPNGITKTFYGDRNDLIVPVNSVHALPYATHLKYRSEGGNHQARHWNGQTISTDIYDRLSPFVLTPNPVQSSAQSDTVNLEANALPPATTTEASPQPAAASSLAADDNQSDPAFTTTATIADTIRQGQTKTHMLYMDGTQPIGFTLYHGSGDLNLTLISPSGNRIDPSVADSDPNIDFVSSNDADGFHLETYGINTPEVGTWTLEVAAPSVVNPYGEEPYFLIGLLTDSTIQMDAQTDRSAYHSGDTIVVHATLREAGAPITGVPVTSRVAYPDGSFTDITLTDTGTGDDQTAGDGIYSGRFSATSQAGLYQLLVSAAGPAPKPFTRDALLLAPVSASTSRFNGTFADRGDDTDGDGLFDELVVDVGVTVTQPATYRVLGELADRSGAPIATATAAVALNAGSQTISLRFDGPSIFQHGVDGPYRLSVVRLAEDDGKALLPLDEQQPAYTTASYNHGQFQHPAFAAADQILTVDEDSSLDITLTAVGADPATSTFQVVASPKHGTLSGTVPHLTYRPNANFNGTDALTFSVNNGTDDSNLATVIIIVNPVDDPPELAPITDQVMDEGTTGHVAVSASDLDGDDLSLSIAGLPTFATFTNNGDGTGMIAFAPGFAAAGVYHLTVTARDESLSASSTFALTVNNVNRPPVADAGGPYTASEGDRTTLDATHSADPDGDSTITRYEWDLDNDGAYDDAVGSTTTVIFSDQGTHQVGLRVADDHGAQATATALVTVRNTPPSLQVGPAQTANEGATTTFTLGAFSDPGADQPWAIDVDWGDGSSHTTFSMNATGTLTPQPHVYADNGTYSVTVTVTDKDGAADTKQFTVTAANVAPTASFSAPAAVTEGSGIMLTLSAPRDVAADLPTLQYAFDCGDGAGYGSFSANSSVSCPTTDSGTRTVKGQVRDKDGGATEYMFVVMVTNVAPTVTAIYSPLAPSAVNSTIVVSATFTDPGVRDTHTAVWDWNDGSSSAGTIDETSGAGSVTATHIYTAAGVYTVKLTVTDKDGDASTVLSQYVVVYDPNGGYVTGGGWFTSPTGAYPSNPTLTGRANFGFTSKYKTGATVPTGQTEFEFQLANLHFHSDTYEWLVVAGARAQYKGTGTINGTGNYGFLLTVIDGQINGGGGVDKFRMKIWDKGSGAIVYDNQIGASDDAGPSTSIQGGSIVIHK